MVTVERVGDFNCTTTYTEDKRVCSVDSLSKTEDEETIIETFDSNGIGKASYRGVTQLVSYFEDYYALVTIDDVEYAVYTIDLVPVYTKSTTDSTTVYTFRSVYIKEAKGNSSPSFKATYKASDLSTTVGVYMPFTLVNSISINCQAYWVYAYYGGSEHGDTVINLTALSDDDFNVKCSVTATKNSDESTYTVVNTYYDSKNITIDQYYNGNVLQSITMDVSHGTTTYEFGSSFSYISVASLRVTIND